MISRSRMLGGRVSRGGVEAELGGRGLWPPPDCAPALGAVGNKMMTAASVTSAALGGDGGGRRLFMTASVKDSELHACVR